MAREKFGDDMVLMIDGNGSYTAKEAIRIGKILEELKYYFYEEPIPWDWYEEAKTSCRCFKNTDGRWRRRVWNTRFSLVVYCQHASDIVQPDPFYLEV